jgi:hypothetical protein
MFSRVAQTRILDKVSRTRMLTTLSTNHPLVVPVELVSDTM